MRDDDLGRALLHHGRFSLLMRPRVKRILRARFTGLGDPLPTS